MFRHAWLIIGTKEPMQVICLHSKNSATPAFFSSALEVYFLMSQMETHEKLADCLGHGYCPLDGMSPIPAAL